ncbi:sulfotransferase / nucleotide-diphospho-sugar transferase [Pontimonas salivibrio]|uniref:Sulfotransferase / nucleotide-diphospho-sugar transferase n=1 Tax=Pontimonas salivibrio TaxID=1159327 RepID=A0A2L2BNB8_9MICO|nr:hypothetical protein [Pontimonas salivibrio]AVG23128.1 sulfotransferase / nucleotide-diphospho-sugar transferase [Pontimonas salivibrio]
MKRLRTLRTRFTRTLNLAQHKLRALFRGHPATHVIVTGSDLPSLHYLVEEIRRVAPALNLPEDPTTASAFQDDFRPVVWSWHPDDSTRAKELVSDVGRYRRIVLIATSADPRDSVCASDPRLPHQFVDSFDYRFRFGADGRKSFTGPGVLARIAGLDQWAEQHQANLLTMTRSELESDPGSVIESLVNVLGEKNRYPHAALTALTEHMISMPPTAAWTGKDSTTRRVVQQIALSPELEARAVEMGYPQAENLLPPQSRRVEPTSGTVIAFHTPDEVYRAEAARLKSTLDRLGLEYHFFEVEPEKNWVRTTLLKPLWMSQARESLDGPLLYIDVDAFVHEDPWPYLNHYDGDLAAVYNNGILNSATIWINDTPGAAEILKRWVEKSDLRRDGDSGELQQTGEDSDQTVLRDIVDQAEMNGDSGFVFQRLPDNLAYIFDSTKTEWLVGPVLIEQLQASRESTRNEKRLARRRERLRELEMSVGEGTRSESPEKASTEEG